MEDPLHFLQEGAESLGVSGLPPETLAQFQVYLQELQTWNARVNLTGRPPPPGHGDQALPRFPDDSPRTSRPPLLWPIWGAAPAFRDWS